MNIFKDRNIFIDYNRYFLEIGYVYVAKTPTLITTILGSCVAVCMHDSKNRFGGMNHFSYPRCRDCEIPTTRYGDVSMMQLYKSFIKFGSDPKDIVARIVGGASISSSELGMKVAEDNVNISKEFLKKNGIKIIFDDTGGVHGRKIYFYTDKNELDISLLTKIKQVKYLNKIE